MEKELKDCPFCGSSPKLWVSSSGDVVSCINVYCIVNSSNGMTRWVDKDKWNTRAPDPRIAELVRLGEKYERIIERGGKVLYPIICSLCQKEKCTCKIIVTN